MLINSWGSGANPWGIDPDDRYSSPTHYDGLLEIVGVSGIVHMGQIQSGISRAHRIAQGSRIKIKIKSEMAVQVDGEPWIQPIGEINILKSALKVKYRFSGRFVSMLLDELELIKFIHNLFVL